MCAKTTVKKAFIKSLPVMAAYVILGMGFGILMDDRGYGMVWSLVCSVFIFAGSMQYITADLLAAAVSPINAAIMALMVNARHIFYGISMIGKYRNMGVSYFRSYRRNLFFALQRQGLSAAKEGGGALLLSRYIVRSDVLDYRNVARRAHRRSF